MKQRRGKSRNKWWLFCVLLVARVRILILDRIQEHGWNHSASTMSWIWSYLMLNNVSFGTKNFHSNAPCNMVSCLRFCRACDRWFWQNPVLVVVLVPSEPTSFQKTAALSYCCHVSAECGSVFVFLDVIRNFRPVNKKEGKQNHKQKVNRNKVFFSYSPPKRLVSHYMRNTECVCVCVCCCWYGITFYL